MLAMSAGRPELSVPPGLRVNVLISSGPAYRMSTLLTAPTATIQSGPSWHENNVLLGIRNAFSMPLPDEKKIDCPRSDADFCRSSAQPLYTRSRAAIVVLTPYEFVMTSIHGWRIAQLM